MIKEDGKKERARVKIKSRFVERKIEKNYVIGGNGRSAVCIYVRMYIIIDKT